MIGHYAGSFDPPHHGHLDIIRRAAALCQRLVVGIAVNPDKTPFLAIETRKALLHEMLADCTNVEIESYSGATALHAQAHGCTVLIRALRTAVDAEFERQLATVNRQVSHLETVLLLAEATTSHLSSSLVRQAAGAGLPLTTLCPDLVAAAIAKRA
jgi:pantetheine-phosphate adenylyltransferase